MSYRTPGRRFGDHSGNITSLVCPRGHGMLSEKEVAPGLTLAFCTDCGGVFASRGAFFRLRNVEESEVALFTEWLSELTPHPEPTARAHCPACAEPMERMRALEHEEGISLDTCFHHGVWFDGGELEAARAHETLIPTALTKVEEARLVKLLRPEAPTLPNLRLRSPPVQKPEHGFLWWLLHVFDSD